MLNSKEVFEALKHMTAADLRKIENVIAKERRDAVEHGFKEMAVVLREDGPMPAKVAAGLVGMTPGQVWAEGNLYRRMGAGVTYFKEVKTKTYTCLEDGETITLTRRVPMVRAK